MTERRSVEFPTYHYTSVTDPQTGKQKPYMPTEMLAAPATPPASETVEAAWKALIIELDEPQPGMTSWGSIQRHRPAIEAAIRAAALDEARAAVGNVRRSRLVGPPANRHLESGPEGHLLDLTEALAAIDALRERDGE